MSSGFSTPSPPLLVSFHNILQSPCTHNSDKSQSIPKTNSHTRQPTQPATLKDHLSESDRYKDFLVNAGDANSRPDRSQARKKQLRAWDETWNPNNGAMETEGR